LRSEVFELLLKEPSSVDLRVERVNLPPTPLQFRLLCTITTSCNQDFRPFSGEEYQPLIKEDVATASLISPP
ncbi:MAG: DNA-binding protein, partial [Nostoc sp.]